MPFADLSRCRDHAYFCEGIVDDLVTALAAVAGLRVISSSSVRRVCANGWMSLQEVATVLSARLLIEGAVQQDLNRIRVSVRVVAPFDGNHVLWADRYDRPYVDILEVQSEIAKTIACHMPVTIAFKPPLPHQVPAKVISASYDAYLRGRFHWNRRTESSLRCALQFFKQATELDGSSALGYSGLAGTYTALSGNEYWLPARGFENARVAAERAIELDPRAAEARVSLAMVLGLYEWQWQAAEAEFRRAIDINPLDANAHHWYGLVLLNVGRVAEATAEIQQAHELDPFSPTIAANVGRPMLYTQRYGDAISEFEKTLAIQPDSPLAYVFLAWALSAAGDGSEAIRAAERAIETSSGNATAVLALAEACAAAGDACRARETIASVWPVHESQGGRYVSAFRVARVYARLGQTDAAFDCLAESLRQRSLGCTTFLTLDPALDGIRHDPRFAVYVDALGL